MMIPVLFEVDPNGVVHYYCSVVCLIHAGFGSKDALEAGELDTANSAEVMPTTQCETCGKDVTAP